MDERSFDLFTRAIGSGQFRRGVLKVLASGVIGSVAAGVGLDRAAATRLRSVGNSCTSNGDCTSGLCIQASRTR